MCETLAEEEHLITQDDEEDGIVVANKFFKVALVEEFMKQYGGILPLWTGMTVPAGIERYNNQPAESHMNIAKRALDEHALQIGYHKV